MAAYWLKPDKLAYDGPGPDLTQLGHRGVSCPLEPEGL